jgi:hypothetical protein
VSGGALAPRWNKSANQAFTVAQSRRRSTQNDASHRVTAGFRYLLRLVPHRAACLPSAHGGRVAWRAIRFDAAAKPLVSKTAG